MIENDQSANPPKLRSQIYVSHDGKKLGPYSAKQIEAKIYQGKLTADDLGWHEGLPEWRPLAEIMNMMGFDVSGPPPPPETEELQTVSVCVMDRDKPLIEGTVSLPLRGVYEPAATLSQKNKLMKMGIQDPSSIRHIGRDQASYLIDQLLNTYREAYRRKRNRQTLIALAFVISLIALFVVTGVLMSFFISSPAGPSRPYKSHPTTVLLPPTAQPQPSQSGQAPSPPRRMGVLLKDITVNIPYGSTVARKGTRVTILRTNGKMLTVRDQSGTEFTVSAELVGP
jgi:hypothetical protein